MIRHEGRFPARLANDLRGFYEGADNLWWPVGVVGASAPCAGECNSWLSGPLSFTCDGGSRRAASWGLGGSSGDSAFYADQGALPFWQDGTFYVTGDAPWDSARIAETTACGMGTYDNTGIVDPAIRFQVVRPYSNGSPAAYFVDSSVTSSIATYGGSFALDGIGFGPGELLKRMKGLRATCVEARAEVQFAGLQARNTVLTIDREWNAFTGAVSRSWQVTEVVNGVTVLNQEWDEDNVLVVNESASDPGPSTVGTLSLALLGIEEDSATITDVNGNPQSVPSDNYVALASTSIGATAGEWSTINVTGLINALLRDSSRSSSYILLPSTGAMPGDLSGLAAYAESLRPAVVAQSSSYNSTDQTWRHAFTLSGQRLQFSSYTIGTILARFRLPSGILEDVRGPLVLQPPRA